MTAEKEKQTMKASLKRRNTRVMEAIILAVLLFPLSSFAGAPPMLSYAPPDITFTYANNTSDYSLTINNIGGETAYDVYLYVEFGVLSVTASSDPYTPGANPYFKLPNIPAGESHTLTFTLRIGARTANSIAR
jgi:hypothetical protein